MESSELSMSFDQLIEGYDLLIGVQFSKIFEKIFDSKNLKIADRANKHYTI